MRQPRKSNIEQRQCKSQFAYHHLLSFILICVAALPTTIKTELGDHFIYTKNQFKKAPHIIAFIHKNGWNLQKVLLIDND
jgi:hypothetical protein